MKTYSILMLVTLGVAGCDSIKKSVIQTDKSVEKLAVEMNDRAGNAGAIQKLSAGDFESFTGQPGKLVVVDFYADWCPPCRQLAPILEKLAVEYGERVSVGKVDIDAYGELASAQGVDGIPDVRFYRDGEQVDKIIGLLPEAELRSRIEKNMGKVEAAPNTVEEKKPENIVGNAIRKANGPEPVEEQPEKIPQKDLASKMPKEPRKIEEPKVPEKPKEPEKKKEPTMQPMKKDWMPPGMQRIGS